MCGAFKDRAFTRRVTSVEAEETLVTQNFLGAVEAVLVHELSYKGASGALVLHPRLHQVYGVHCCRSRGYTQVKSSSGYSPYISKCQRRTEKKSFSTGSGGRGVIA